MTEDKFAEYQNLLRRMAWSFHYSTSIEWEELYSEACLAFVKAMRSYDENGAAASTWIYQVVKNRLIDYTKQQRRFIPADFEFKRVYGLTPEAAASFRQAVLPKMNNPWKGCSLVRDMHVVISIVLQSPAEYLASNGRMRIRKQLRKLGWNQKRIAQTFCAVKAAL